MQSGERRGGKGKGIESGERRGAAAGKGRKYAIRRAVRRHGGQGKAICNPARGAAPRRATARNIRFVEQSGGQGKGIESGGQSGAATGEGKTYAIRRAAWRARDRNMHSGEHRGGQGKGIEFGVQPALLHYANDRIFD